MFTCRPYMRPLHQTVRNECVKTFSKCFFYIAGDAFDIHEHLILRTCDARALGKYLKHDDISLLECFLCRWLSLLLRSRTSLPAPP